MKHCNKIKILFVCILFNIYLLICYEYYCAFVTFLCSTLIMINNKNGTITPKKLGKRVKVRIKQPDGL